MASCSKNCQSLVKRLCEAVGHPVARLHRHSYAGVGIEGMAPGELRYLSPREVRMLRAAVRTEAPLPPGGLRRRSKRPGAGAVRDPIFGTIRREGGRRPPLREGGRGRGGPGRRPKGRGV